MPVGLPGQGGRGVIVVPSILTPPASDFTVDWTSPQQTIDGFGAASKHANPWTTTATADLLWSPTSGIGLSLVRDGISKDGYPLRAPFGGGNEANDPTFAALAQITAYGAVPWGTIWFFPQGTDEAGVSNGSADWSDGTGALAVAHYGDAATLLTTYLDRASALGIYPRGVSFMNEPDLNLNSTTHWSTSQALAFVKNNLSSALTSWGAANSTWRAATGLSKPWILLGETGYWANLATWTTAFEGDPTALSEIGYYGTHQYNGGGASAPGTISRPIWETEYYPQDGAFSQSITDGLDVAQRIHDALTTGNAGAWHFWWCEQPGTASDNEGLIGDGSSLTSSSWNSPPLTKRLYALGNWSRFVRPGWQRISVSGAKSGIYGVTAFRNVSSGKLAVVVVNNSGSSVTLTIGLHSPLISSLAPWVTSGTAIGSIGSDGNLSNGSSAASLATSLALAANQLSVTVPNGVTTFVN